MRVAAIVGESGSGKTTLIVALIRHFVTAGQRVAAIKHTHHPLNDDRRGDTAAFESAGAKHVIFARDGEAIASGKKIRFQSPRDLLDHLDADIVLIEGFKHFDDWPRVELDGTRRIPVEEALTILDRMWASK
jgi:molybdopterin-guanine dinucleotide biosynthesis protein MobB